MQSKIMTKKNRAKSQDNIFQKSQIELLASEGTSDVEIARLLDVGSSYVQTVTTAFWKRKMESKEDYLPE